MDFSDPITVIEFIIVPMIAVPIGIRIVQEILHYLKNKPKGEKIEKEYTNDIKDNYDKNDFDKPFVGE